jgi:hypothetical protein
MAFMLSRDGNQKFLRDSWLAHWGLRRSVRLPRDGGADCGRDWCLLPASAGNVLVADGPAEGAPCPRAALVVAAQAVCGAGVPVVETSLARGGAVSAWLTSAGAVIETDRTARGVRPWRPPAMVWTHTSLPMAEHDSLPDGAS